jgi:vacuolar-type H+-ATPase subunit H
MGEVIRFIKKSERERDRLIREARAMYDSVFPPADPASEQRDKAPAAHTVSGANAYRSDGVLP